jgi:DNA-binding NarL/FixJ family response regulator
MTSEGRVRVVVADDADDLRYLYRLELELDGECVVVGDAGSGQEAIEQAAAHRPDVLLLDLTMPDMDGLAALPRILDVSPATAVVVVSGYVGGAAADEARRLGATAIVDKAAVLTDLKHVVLAAADRTDG